MTNSLKDLQALVEDGYSSDEETQQQIILDDDRTVDFDNDTTSHSQQSKNDTLSVDELKKLLHFIDEDDISHSDEKETKTSSQSLFHNNGDEDVDDDDEDYDYEARVSNFVTLHDEDNQSLAHIKRRQDKKQMYKAFMQELTNGQLASDETTSLTHNDLSSIHSELFLQGMQTRVGAPSALKVTDDLIAIGTSYGLIILYERHTLRRVAILGSVLGSPTNNPSVTALSFGGLLSRFLQLEKKSKRRILIAGYSDGKLIYWNTETFLPLKVVDSSLTSITQPIFKICSLQHGVDDLSAQGCVVVDASGLIRQVIVRKVMFSYSVEVASIQTQAGGLNDVSEAVDAYSIARTIRNNIFGAENQQSKAFIADIDVLSKGEAPIPLNNVTLLAIATRTDVIIKTLRPEMKNVAILKPPSDNLKPPAVSWMKNTLPDGLFNAGEVIGTGTSPKLAVSWGSTLRVYQISNYSPSSELTLLPLHNYEVATPFPVENIYWLAADVLAVVGSNQNKIALVVPSQQSVVDQLDITSVDTMYIDFAHALGTMSQVSDKNRVTITETLDTATNTASGAVLKFGFKVLIKHISSSVYLLGQSGFLTLRCQSWDELISNLCKSGRYQHGLELASNIYLGSPVSSPLVGLPANETKRKSESAEIISTNLILYATTVIKNDLQDKREENFVQVGKRCLKYCLDIQNYSIINNLYNMYIQEGQKDVFIDLIVKECLVTGRLSALEYCTDTDDNPLFNDIVSKYSRTSGDMDVLETAILNLTLNKQYYQFEVFNKLYSPSKPSKMLRAYLYANNALRDYYLEPLKDLMPFIEDVEAGSTIIDYLRACASGRSISSAYTIDEAFAPKLKKSTLDFILASSSDKSALDRSSCKNLVALMKNYPDKFFEILNIMFFDNSPSSPFEREEAKDDNNEEYALEELSKFVANAKKPTELKYSRQDISDKLLSVICPPASADVNSSLWTTKQLSSFYVFEAGLLHAGYISLPAKHMKKMVSHLITDMPNVQEQEELRSRQVIVQNIMEKLRASELDIDHYTLLCEKNKCYHLAAYLYKKKDNFAKAIQSFLHIENTIDAFDYLVELTSIDMRTNFFPQVNKAILDNISALMKANPEETVNVIVEHFHYLHQDIIDVLASSPEYELQFYYYLKLVLRKHEESNELYQKNIDIDDDFLYHYVRLMCKYDSANVKDYITKHQINRVEEILKDCIDIPNAVSFLLERKGEIAQAFEYLFKDMDQVLSDLKAKLKDSAISLDIQDQLYRDLRHIKKNNTSSNEDNVEELLFNEEESEPSARSQEDEALAALKNLPLINNSLQIEELPEVKSLEEKVSEAIDMCKRNTQRKTIDEKSVKKLWFDLLTKFNFQLRAYRQGYNGIDINKTDSAKSTDDSDLDPSGESEEEKKWKQEMENNEKRRRLYMDQLISLKQEYEQESDEEKKQEIDEDIKKKARLAQMAQKKVQVAQQKLEQIQLEKQQVTVDPSAPLNLHKLANLWLQKILYKIVKHIIEEMIEYVSIPDILQQVIADNRRDDFSYVKHTVFQLLDKDMYDQELLGITNNILESDTFSLCKDYTHKLQKGVYPSHSKCIICGYSLVRRWTEDKIVRVNEDGSVYHLSCFYGGRKKRATNDASTSKYEQVRERCTQFNSILEQYHPNGKMPLYRNLQVDNGLVSVKNQKKKTDTTTKLPYSFEVSLVDQSTQTALTNLQLEKRSELLKLASNSDTSKSKARQRSNSRKIQLKKLSSRREDFTPSFEASVMDMDGVRNFEDLFDQPLLY